MSTPPTGPSKRTGQAVFVPADDGEGFEHAVVMPDDDPTAIRTSLYPSPVEAPDVAARVAALVAVGWEPRLETDPVARLWQVEALDGRDPLPDAGDYFAPADADSRVSPALVWAQEPAPVPLPREQLPALDAEGDAYPWEPEELSTVSLVRLVNHLEQAVELCKSAREAHEKREAWMRDKAVTGLSASAIGALVAIVAGLSKAAGFLRPLPDWLAALGIMGGLVLVVVALVMPFASVYSADGERALAMSDRVREAALRAKLAAYRSELQIRKEP